MMIGQAHDSQSVRHVNRQGNDLIGWEPFAHEHIQRVGQSKFLAAGLIANSQTDAALRCNEFAGSARTVCAAALGLPSMSHKKVCVSRRSFIPCTP